MTRLVVAHTRPDGALHSLEEHLSGVARLASELARPFGADAQAEIAGLWHDLGKYAQDFQAYLQGATAAQAHLENDAEIAVGKKVDHSSAGALHAVQCSKDHGLAIAFAIAGHHAGLSDRLRLAERLGSKQPRLEAARRGGAPLEILTRTVPPIPPVMAPRHARDEDGFRRFELYTRMLFSALCDADFLDTEAFFDPKRAAMRGGGLTVADLAPRISAWIDLKAKNASTSHVNRIRNEIRSACRARAAAARGILTLTIPTGGGKTLTAMELALHHALAHGLRRVIVALPFTAIIEQSAQEYRKAFGTGSDDITVLEHHASLDPKQETAKSRVACENWDAPIVVTTNVQLLESLFAARPAKCRKLHRIAHSVIVLDEAQALPRGMLAPTIDVLEALVRDYGCSVLLCTATQPALLRAQLGSVGFEKTTELAPDPASLAAQLRRVEVDFSRTSMPVPYETLAEELALLPSVLAIVHRRADARLLVQAIDRRTGDTSTEHLSALMCPAHRQKTLASIVARKARGEALRVVATQVVEAGVDLDFPVVYRALAGLDSLVQAAGRCNREGRLDGLGVLRVFRAETEPPSDMLKQALAITESMLAAGPLDLFAPETLTKFFARLYGVGGAGGYDEKAIQRARAELRFAHVAESYRIIDEDWAAPVVIPWDARGEEAIRELRMLGPSRDRIRALSQFTVTVNRKDVEAWRSAKLVEDIGEGAATVLLERHAYDDRFGLDPTRVGLPPPSVLVV